MVKVLAARLRLPAASTSIHPSAPYASLIGVSMPAFFVTLRPVFCEFQTRIEDESIKCKIHSFYRSLPEEPFFEVPSPYPVLLT